MTKTPLPCEELVRPLAQLDLHHLEGRWALVAGSYLPNLERFKQRDSAAVYFSRNTSDTTTSYSGSILVDNKCLYKYFNITMEGGSFTYDGTNKSVTSARFVHVPCPDCLVMHVNLVSRKQRREVEQKEMEEFRAQVQCLNLPPPVVMDPTKELCPEETPSDPTAQPEEKTVEQKN
uniref:Apolipoprotein M n=1 Tax=Monopterus albus TaxID=43700 RepID=A0A3Q3KLK3_MONAL